MAKAKTSMVRVVLFFAPHLAIVFAILGGEVLGWDAMLRLCGVACALLPWWCRFVGKPWSVAVRYLLGAGLATLGFVALFVWVLMNSEGPNDWTLAALILAVTVAFVPYSLFASFWRAT